MDFKGLLEKIKNSKKVAKHGKSILIIIIILAIIVSISSLAFYLYEDDIKIGNITITNPLGITDEYLTKNFKDNGYDQFDSCKVHKLAVADIDYKGYNKLVFAALKLKNNGVTLEMPGLLLVNRKKNEIEGITINNNVLYILDGIYKEKVDYQKAVNIAAVNIESHGAEVFNGISNEKMIKELTEIISLKKARSYVESDFRKYANSTSLEYTLLYKKGTAIVKYIAFKETVQAYNSSYPMDENTYKYFKGSYKYSDTLNTFQYVYGPPYVTKTQYSVLDVYDKTEIGAKDTLSQVKKWLNVEEADEISSTSESTYNSETTSNINTGKTSNIDSSNENTVNTEKVDNTENTNTTVNDNQNSTNNNDNYSNDNYNDEYVNEDYNNYYSNYEVEEEEPKEEYVNISDVPNYYPKFKDAKAEIEKRGLVVNEIIEEEEVEHIYYSEENDDSWKTKDGGYYYKKGSTVDIVHIKEKLVASKIRTRIDFNTLISETEYVPLLNKNDKIKDGAIQVYIDGKLAFTYSLSKFDSSSPAYEYSFEPNKTIHIKLYAPYAIKCSNYNAYTSYLSQYDETQDEDAEYKENWVIKEYDLNTNDLPQYFDLYTLIKWY